MDREQLQGVAAHELAHIANRDTLVSAVAATTAGAIALLSDLVFRMMWFRGGQRNSREGGNNPILLIASLLILILAPIAAVMLRSAISRKREALADATAIDMTRNPAGLRRALEVLAADSTVVQQRSTAVAHVWIESPLDASAASKLFATHPPIQERINLLKSMEDGTYGR
jgi:heat shock protein HtpX